MRAAVGLVLVLSGVVWILQGLDVPWAPRSVMTGDWRWVAAGIVAVAGGLWLLLANRIFNR